MKTAKLQERILAATGGRGVASSKCFRWAPARSAFLTAKANKVREAFDTNDGNLQQRPMLANARMGEAFINLFPSRAFAVDDFLQKRNH